MSGSKGGLVQGPRHLSRCIFAPVKIVSDEVMSFRRRFDSLHGKCPTHVTLVFPFVSKAPDGELTRALETAAAKARGALDLVLLAPRFDSGYVVLPVEHPNPWLLATHQDLSRLGGVSSTDGYRPHVTVGRNLTSAPVAEMATLPSRLHTRIDCLVLEEMQEDESSRVIQRSCWDDPKKMNKRASVRSAWNAMTDPGPSAAVAAALPANVQEGNPGRIRRRRA